VVWGQREKGKKKYDSKVAPEIVCNSLGVSVAWRLKQSVQNQGETVDVKNRNLEHKWPLKGKTNA